MRPLLVMIALASLVACAPARRDDGNGGGGGGGDDDTGSMGADGGITPCQGNSCSQSCQDAEDNHASIGCDYYAVDMDGASGPPYDACFTVFVANTSMQNAHITASYGGQTIDLSQFAKLPVGAGQSLTYGAYDPTTGLAPGQVAILFLDYNITSIIFGAVACPVAAAVTSAQVHGTGIGTAFHIQTDTPVVAYQMLPYGGGAAAATGASLLIPTSAWQNNYLAVSAWDDPPLGIDLPINFGGPSHDIVAYEDNTTVTMRPISAIAAGSGVPAGSANSAWSVTLNAGQFVQLTQSDPLSGSPITSSAPVGVFGGHQIMGIDRCCGDHGEQMLTPISALGDEYVAAPHGTRKPTGTDPRVFHIWGTVDGTQLTYEPAGVGSATVNQGQMVEIRTNDLNPFVVRSQDSSHPFALFTYMTGAGDDSDPGGSDYDPNWVGGWGDPDFVRIPPPPQFLSHYVFFTDATYPFTTLTVVREEMNGAFADVSLDCLGVIPESDWQAVGTSGEYQIAYIKLVDHWNTVTGSCNNGVHVMDSTNQFGVWVWGWGSEDTNTGWVSYGYPAGEGVLPINTVIIQ